MTYYAMSHTVDYCVRFTRPIVLFAVLVTAAGVVISPCVPPPGLTLPRSKYPRTLPPNTHRVRTLFVSCPACVLSYSYLSSSMHRHRQQTRRAVRCHIVLASSLFLDPAPPRPLSSSQSCLATGQTPMPAPRATSSSIAPPVYCCICVVHPTKSRRALPRLAEASSLSPASDERCPAPPRPVHIHRCRTMQVQVCTFAFIVIDGVATLVVKVEENIHAV